MLVAVELSHDDFGKLSDDAHEAPVLAVVEPVVAVGRRRAALENARRRVAENDHLKDINREV